MTVCIIPARSGSKRIKNKNIKLFNGKPIISYAIQLAKTSGLFERIVVSTDSPKISKIAKKYGAEVPFLRSKKLADDFTSTTEVMIDCIKKISSHTSKYHFCLYPTTTLLSKKDLINSLKKIKKNNFDHLIPVSQYNVNPYRAFKFVAKNRIVFKSKKFISFRFQDLPKLCHDTGSFYIYKTKNLLKFNGRFPIKTTYYLLDTYKAINIDTESDFKFAECMYKYIKSK